MRFAFIRDQVAKRAFPVAFMCAQLAVSQSGFYVWLTRPVSAHHRRELELGRLITTLFNEHQGRYGVRPISPS